MSSAMLASISPVRFERLRAMAAALDRSLETLASISWTDAIVDCASAGTAISGIGVGAGFGFAGEAEACSADAEPPLKNETRIRSEMSRLTAL
jgi:hypothetical protein